MMPHRMRRPDASCELGAAGGKGRKHGLPLWLLGAWHPMSQAARVAGRRSRCSRSERGLAGPYQGHPAPNREEFPIRTAMVALWSHPGRCFRERWMTQPEGAQEP